MKKKSHNFAQPKINYLVSKHHPQSDESLDTFPSYSDSISFNTIRPSRHDLQIRLFPAYFLKKKSRISFLFLNIRRQHILIIHDLFILRCTDWSTNY